MDEDCTIHFCRWARERERERERERDRQTDRHTDRQTDRDRVSQSGGREEKRKTGIYRRIARHK